MIENVMTFLILFPLFVSLALKVDHTNRLSINFYITVSILTIGCSTNVNNIVIQTGKIVPPSRSDNIQMEQVAAKKEYEIGIKISSNDDNF